MEFNSHALILQVKRFREADLLVKFFSADQGIMTAFAFGGSRSRRRFCGCLDWLNHVHFKIKRSDARGYLCLMEGLLLSSPSRLRQDPGRLGLAANCLKFLEAAVPSPVGADRAYRLCLQTLAMLDEHEQAPALLPSMFKARLLHEQGLGPDLSACPRCGQNPLRHEFAVLNIDLAQITCLTCPPFDGPRLRLPVASLQAIQTIETAPPSDWPAIQLTAPERQAFGRAVDGLVSYHLGLGWENGRYRPC